ncbi:aminotransferase class I/II-fold pyridoxal phosphate-dependent enzyme [Paenibacillus sp. HW567]|uniref:aminotransferase class I/II-fold pyridoxal phosphate-dependent enzyme n=1 Tax=Paenibacillus sp. HW567 TaxID=1034769 RepID=UPI00036411FB|nr:aminotransferase class I/II-fold pyridoxal phosphate-dependent enzyme [Paenibacillus sp. HW567]
MTHGNIKKSWRAEKLSQLGSSIFAEVAEWKAEAYGSGLTVIDLGIGSPDGAPRPEIREALSSAVLREDCYSYPSSKGSLAFRKQAAAWMDKRFGVKVDAEDEVLALMGSQDGLAHLALAICNPGDLAIVPDPGYPIYSGSLAIAGVQPWYIPLLQQNDFVPDLDQVPDHIWRDAVFILLNFPGNPISTAVDAVFFEKLVALARKWGVLIIHDLAYSEMGFDGYKPLSILEISGAIETAVEFHSFSKSFNMAGCRIGFLTGNREALGALRELKGNMDFGVFEPIQEAAVLALELAMDDLESGGIASLYERRRDLFVAELAREGWSVPAPKATMFIWAALPQQWTLNSKGGGSRAFARDLLLKTGVAVIPGDAFGEQGEGFVRIALVQGEERLLEAARRIGEYLRRL